MIEEELPSYLAGEVEPEVVSRFFTAAAALFRAAPWKGVTEDQVVRIDIPRLGIDGSCLSVIGHAGQSFGFLLFRSLDDFDDFIGGGGSGLLSVSFGSKKLVAPSMLEEIREHAWLIAGPKGYPSALSFDAKREALDVTERDYEVLTAAAVAFTLFFERHRRMFKAVETETVREPFDHHGLEVVITAPYE
ncbi:MAG: hypothetical protein ACXW2P_01430 [Thermoanaerobaculia bacterium]